MSLKGRSFELRTLTKNVTIVSTLAILAISGLIPAYAGASGRKNAAIAMTAATVYSAFRRNKTAAAVFALGSAQAWKNYEDARKRESSWRNHQYNHNYNYSRRSGYGRYGNNYNRPNRAYHSYRR